MPMYDDFADDMKREKSRLEKIMPSNRVYYQKDLHEIGMAPTPEAGGLPIRDTLRAIKEHRKASEPVPLGLEERVAMRVVADRLDIRLTDIVRTRRIQESKDLDKSNYKIMCEDDNTNHGTKGRLIHMSGVTMASDGVRATVWTGQCPGCLMIYWGISIEEQESPQSSSEAPDN